MGAPSSVAIVVCTALWALGCHGTPEKGPAPASSSQGKNADGGEKEHADVELSDEALEAAKLTIVKARTGARTRSVTVSGVLDFNPQRTARIGPLLDGRVLAVRVKQGDEVAAGAALATITSIDVGRARADHMAALARLQQADSGLAREKKLAESRASSERDLVAAETTRSLAAVEVQAAAERLRAAGAGPGGTGASLTLITPLGGRVIEADARLGQSVRATDTLFVVGDTRELWLIGDLYERDIPWVKTGDPVKVTIAALPGKVFEGRVDHVHARIDPVRRSTDVRVVLQNPVGALLAGMSATARILSTAPAPSPASRPASILAPASASAQPLASALAAGSASTAGAASARGSDRDGADVNDAILVPRGALQSIDGQPFVFVAIEKGKFEMRAVVRGDDLEGDVEIRRGLAGGESVVADGSFLLKSHVLREQMGSND